MKKKTDIETENLQKQIEEWKAKYLRALADYQNLEKRMVQRALESEQLAAQKVIHELLVVLDTLEAAQKHVKNEGLHMGLGGFEAVLKHHGVKKMEVLHKPFDPNSMECVEAVNGEKDNEVVEEIRPGYYIGEKVLRPARVKVSKKLVS